MALNKNPFDVFGLSPEAVSRLGEKDLFALLRSMYRSLQKVYHPDCATGRGATNEVKSNQSATELNLAF